MISDTTFDKTPLSLLVHDLRILIVSALDGPKNSKEEDRFLNNPQTKCLDKE